METNYFTVVITGKRYTVTAYYRDKTGLKKHLNKP